MKILCINLLRLGDVVMSTAVVDGLQKRYPKAQIDFLLNKQFSSLTPLLPHIRRFLFFDRDRFQSLMANVATPLTQPFFELQEFVGQINSEKYDLVINLTQNLFSARLMDLLECSNKLGFNYQNGKAEFGSNWFRRLNANDSDKEFHYIDFLLGGSEVSDQRPEISLVETTHGQHEAKKITDGRPVIAVQPLTSDRKKNWGIGNYRKLISLLSLKLPRYHFVILGSPSEEQFLEDLSAANVTIAICDLETAFSILCRADLVVTGDTSIKHMAAASGTKIFEICLGSSEYRFTGAYNEGALIVKSRVKCAPCAHGKDCHQPTQLCAEMMEPDFMAILAAAYLSDDMETLQKCARNSSLEILRVKFSPSGLWRAMPVDSVKSSPQERALHGLQ